MTIRSRLLFWLLPILILFVALISLFFFFNWDKEIRESFRNNLKSIVVTAADLIDAKEIEWIDAHRNDPDLVNSPLYQKNLRVFRDLKAKLPIANIFVLTIEPVKLGEPVLSDRPLDATNQIYNGSNPDYAYRQVYLIDPEEKKVYQDFSETNEFLVYSTKSPLLTPIYRGLSSNELFMTGYAPIFSNEERVIALVGADVNMDLFHKIVQDAIFIMIGFALVTIALVSLLVVFIANKIALPVNDLKNAALAIAAGDYEEKVDIKGPKEIAELANTFNTMRECLLDHMNRLRDSSFLREKLFGEQECAGLLQNRMTDGVIERLGDERITIKHIASTFSGPTMQGIKLKITSSPTDLLIVLYESDQEGFNGLYDLLDGVISPSLTSIVRIDFSEKKIWGETHLMPPPLVWSTEQGKFLPDSLDFYPALEGDYIFLFNQEMATLFPHRQTIRDWIGKVMRQFSKETPELLSVMLTSELSFWSKKLSTSLQAHLFWIKINISD